MPDADLPNDGRPVFPHESHIHPADASTTDQPVNVPKFDDVMAAAAKLIKTNGVTGVVKNEPEPTEEEAFGDGAVAFKAMHAFKAPRKLVRTEIGVFIVQGLTALDRDSFEASLVLGKGKRQTINTINIRAKLVAMCVIDKDGRRLFSKEDASQLGQLPVKIIGPLYDAAQELSSVSDDDIEEMAGN